MVSYKDQLKEARRVKRMQQRATEGINLSKPVQASRVWSRGVKLGVEVVNSCSGAALPLFALLNELRKSNPTAAQRLQDVMDEADKATDLIKEGTSKLAHAQEMMKDFVLSMRSI